MTLEGIAEFGVVDDVVEAKGQETVSAALVGVTKGK